MDGSVHFYDWHTSRKVSRIHGHKKVCLEAVFHPLLPSTVASVSWDNMLIIYEWNGHFRGFEMETKINSFVPLDCTKANNAATKCKLGIQTGFIIVSWIFVEFSHQTFLINLTLSMESRLGFVHFHSWNLSQNFAMYHCNWYIWKSCVFYSQWQLGTPKRFPYIVWLNGLSVYVFLSVHHLQKQSSQYHLAIKVKYSSPTLPASVVMSDRDHWNTHVHAKLSVGIAITESCCVVR